MVVPEPVEGEQTQGSVAVLVKQPLPLWEQQQQGRLGLREAQEVEAGLEAEASQVAWFLELELEALWRVPQQGRTDMPEEGWKERWALWQCSAADPSRARLSLSSVQTLCHCICSGT